MKIGLRTVVRVAAAVALVGAGSMSRNDWSMAVRMSAQDLPIFSARSDLVMLHVTVTDRRGRYVTDVPRESFRVFDNGAPQSLQFFLSEDAPATIGLVIDNSQSMQPNREQMIAAAKAFVATSNPRDEVFALTFNNSIHAVLPSAAPFTSDADTISRALDSAIKPSGQSAVHSAILAGLDYLERGRYERKVLVLVSDGADNASPVDFDSTLSRVESSNVVVYSVGLLDTVFHDGKPDRLRQLAKVTGGGAFFPKDTHEVSDTLQRVADDIRHAYVLAYEPTDAVRRADVHRIRVAVEGPQRAVIRTRSGYRSAAVVSGEVPHER